MSKFLSLPKALLIIACLMLVALMAREYFGKNEPRDDRIGQGANLADSHAIDSVPVPTKPVPTEPAPTKPVPTETVKNSPISAVPIIRPKSSSGKFVRLGAEETGLDFRADVVPDHDLSRLYHSGFAAGGVAIGDVDGNGTPDIFCVGAAQSSRLYKQTSAFKFVDATESSGLSSEANPWSAGASFVDIDNDDDLDLYVCNYASPNQLWINDGQGNFTEQAKKFGVDVNDSSMMAYFGDFDNDGFVDMYLLTNRLFNEEGWVSNFDIGQTSNGEYIIRGKFAKYFKLVPKPDGKFTVAQKGRDDFLFRNNGGQGFTDVSKEAGIAGDGHGLSAVLWDYDNDNDLDIYVCNDFQESDKLYENQGDGKFQDVIRDVLKATSWFSMGSDIGDINNDGRVDLFTADMSGSSHYLSKILMGSMTKHEHFLDTAEPRQNMRNFLHINAGSVANSSGSKSKPRFLETAQISGIDSTDWSWAPVLRDFDGDRYCDLFVTNGHVRNFNNPDIDVEQSQDLQSKTYWNIYKDEKPMPQVNVAFRNTDGSHFEETATAWGLDHNGISFAAASGDLDQDGDLDLIVMNLDEPVSVYRNDISNANSITIRLKGTRSNRDGIGAKVRIQTEAGIQLIENSPHRGFLASHEPLVHFGLGQQTRINKLVVEWPTGIAQVFEGIDANQLLTIIEPDSGPTVERLETTPLFAQINNISFPGRRERTYDDFKLQPLLPNKLSQLGPGVAVADLGTDGRDDLYVSSPFGRTKRYGVRGENESKNGISFKEVPVDIDMNKEEYAPIFFDADGDHDLDLYIVCGGVESEGRSERLTDTLLINDNNGNFVLADPSSIPDTQFSGSAAAVADYDRDGDLDLFVGGRVVAGKYPTTPRSMLMRNESQESNNPIFVDATIADSSGLEKPGMVTSALWSDVNNDGWIDLLLTTEWGPVRVYVNNQGNLVEATELCGLANHLGWWNGITGADFDRDGDIDYVVTNFGQNTKYSASAKKPARLYYGKFGNNLLPTIIEAKTAETCELPVRGKSCSQHAMPHLADKFPTYHEFALAGLDDIYSKSDMDAAEKFEVNELSSCLLRNDGQGVFSLEPLPWLAQLAPGFGVVATDTNSDGWTDLFIAQNFFTPQRETGRMAGGLSTVLLGSESGEFDSLWADSSGIAIEADAKGAAISDFNQDLRPDLVVGINDEEPRFFYNQTVSNQPLVIRLIGAGKNSQAIGSRVEILLEDGSTQTAEVYGGGSYLSQSTRDLFFGLGESGKIKKIKIRWPNGNVQVLDPPTNLKEVVEFNQ